MPAGTRISAWIDGVKYAETPAFLSGEVSVYCLDVPGDIRDTTRIEGGREGDTIRFRSRASRRPDRRWAQWHLHRIYSGMKPDEH